MCRFNPSSHIPHPWTCTLKPYIFVINIELVRYEVSKSRKTIKEESLMYGYTGRILRVDLSKEKSWTNR